MNRTRAVVICLLIGTLMASLPTFLLMEPPKGSETFLNIVLGWFIAKGSDAVAYLLNSTAASAVRNESMAKANDALVDQVRSGTATSTTIQVPSPATISASTADDELTIPPIPKGT